MSKKRGFTLLEILIVMAILGILAVIVVPQLSQRPKQAKHLKAVLQIKSFQDALEFFNVDRGVYPTSSEGLDGLIRVGNQNHKKYLEADKIPLDPWGHPYLYLSPGLQGRSYDIASFGQDGRRGGSGWDQDIESWNLNEENSV
ncbi:MAG: type II secretion system major pseudopilin GspG [Chlamydiae bacterium]|nr:type II secretion system major pseudopilin GspG [Chlamydiota bacterium]MBI3266088.1 type II secretion system major pseudopilin GspG [Chlamydiota bacterium]